MKSRICNLWSPLNRPWREQSIKRWHFFLIMKFHAKYLQSGNYRWERRWSHGLVLSPLSSPWFYLLKLLLFRTKLISFKMATPFFLPPPSSFGVPPGCTVSLSSPSLVLTFISVSLPSPSSRYISSSYRCCSKQVLPSANSTQVTSRGLFSWLRTGVTCPPTMGLRKSCEKKFPSPKKCDTCFHFHVVSFIGNGDDMASYFFKRMYCIRYIRK